MLVLRLAFLSAVSILPARTLKAEQLTRRAQPSERTNHLGRQLSGNANGNTKGSCAVWPVVAVAMLVQAG
jgi:hypothetical protein